MKLLPLLILALLIGCADASFHRGQMVRAKVGGKVGQVIDVDCISYYGCRYLVRFASLEINANTSTLGADGPVQFSPLSLVRLREFELEAVK